MAKGELKVTIWTLKSTVKNQIPSFRIHRLQFIQTTVPDFEGAVSLAMLAASEADNKLCQQVNRTSVLPPLRTEF